MEKSYEKDATNLEKAHERQLKISSGCSNCLTRTDLNRLGKFRGKKEGWKGANIIKVQRNLQQIYDLKPKNIDRTELYSLRGQNNSSGC